MPRKTTAMTVARRGDATDTQMGEVVGWMRRYVG
jgi:hypothetical protein